MLPEIRPNAEVYGTCATVLPGVPVAGALGDQQAALVGQACFAPGEAKCTYGTGAFLLMNTGPRIARSTHGLIPTVGYVLGDDPVYALEGSIAVTGSLVQWFRDALGMISTAAQIETLATTVPDNGGCYIVPAFSGLYAPALASGGARGDGRADVLHHPRAPGPGGAGGDRVADPRGRRRDERRLGGAGDPAQGRRRDDREPPADAVPRGRPGRAGRAPAGVGGGVARARPTRRGWRSGTGRTWRCCAATGTARPPGSRRWTPTCAAASARTGAARWTAATAGPPPRPPSSPRVGRNPCASVRPDPRESARVRARMSGRQGRRTCTRVRDPADSRGHGDPSDRGIRSSRACGRREAVREGGREPGPQLAHRLGRVDVLHRAELAELAAAGVRVHLQLRARVPALEHLLAARGEAVGDALDGQVEARHGGQLRRRGVEQRAVLRAPVVLRHDRCDGQAHRDSRRGPGRRGRPAGSATGSVPPSKRAADVELTEARIRVRPPCGRSSNGPTAPNFVVARSCTGPGNVCVPMCVIVAARLPVRCSMPSGSV